LHAVYADEQHVTFSPCIAKEAAQQALQYLKQVVCLGNSSTFELNPASMTG
jgi:hypothetical protein